MNYRHFLGLVLVTLSSSLLSHTALAVPSFARQTGMSCASCHTVFPELNAFGRSFKLNGYTLTGIKQVSGKNLQINELPPLSMMLQVAAVNSKQEVDGTPRNPSTSYSLPDELSLFFAGEISPHLGSFIQMTMEQGTGFSLDNTDIRFANRTSNDITYGVTLNNSPSSQDVWNSTPVWGYPWTHGAEITAPLIADALAQNVAGLGVYADWGNNLYTELGLYSATNPFDAPSGSAPGQVRVHGSAPYWRLAWNKTLSNNDNLMLGTYGMQTDLVEETNYDGPTDSYDDVAIDAQYEHPLSDSEDTLSVHASYTDEKQALALSGGGSPRLKSTRLDGTYHWGHELAATLGYANNSSNSNSLEDTAYTGQLSYLPWQNTKFTLQYVAYSKLAGNSKVSDANTLALQAWLLW